MKGPGQDEGWGRPGWCLLIGIRLGGGARTGRAQVGARVALGLAWSRTLTCILSQLESTRRASLHVALSAKSTGMLPLATSHSTSSVRRENGIVAVSAPFRPTFAGFGNFGVFSSGQNGEVA